MSSDSTVCSDDHVNRWVFDPAINSVAWVLRVTRLSTEVIQFSKVDDKAYLMTCLTGLIVSFLSLVVNSSNMYANNTLLGSLAVTMFMCIVLTFSAFRRVTNNL